MLIDELKKAQMEALKTKDTLKRSVLQIVTGKVKLAEIEKRTKNEALTDDDVLLVINKVIKELDEEILAFKNANRLEKVEELTLQKQILEAYLPAKLTEEEIREIINSLEDKSMPNIMKHFKLNYLGKCDMKLVNKLANEYK
ncbi:MAG: GatB/YqeY domain-containing protein [Bacilli bacterium]|nr:GatB/YqeY domain-containing protein [Bacilli bacterium]